MNLDLLLYENSRNECFLVSREKIYEISSSSSPSILSSIFSPLPPFPFKFSFHYMWLDKEISVDISVNA